MRRADALAAIGKAPAGLLYPERRANEDSAHSPAFLDAAD
ncbi:MAG: hypothetical protein KatS3mg055_2844 [Chloroflexus sp.]|nr:MAG: hypothetical protein KatS3mg055_2844 [Chloroflexus sp.]